MLYNIYVIKNLENGHQYIDYTDKPLNKKWKELLANYDQGTNSLCMSMKRYGVNRFKIGILEEWYTSDIDDRMEYWFNRYSPEYNCDVIEFTNNAPRTHKSNRKWGYQRVHKPKAKHPCNTIKSRCITTGKIKTHHGWKAAAEFANGRSTKIREAIARDGTAYGYKWWVYKQIETNKRKVYGIHKEGHVTPIFDSISEAMRAMGGDDRGKGICTSLKWNQRWRGYMWYYADVQ